MKHPITLSKFQGVMPAMNSCFDAQGEVSAEAVKKLTRFLIDKGVSGLYVGGSTGEGPMHSVSERQKYLEAVLEAARGEVTVIAQIGAINTRDSVELAKHAERSGADAISSIPPFYYHCSDQGVAKHWTTMMESTELPFIIYHIPSTTGHSLSQALLRQMIQNPKVIGVKISSASTYELQQFKAIGGSDFLIFNGPDEQYLAGRIMGATAGIGGTYGVMPELFVRMEQFYSQGDIAEAQRIQYKINEIITALLALPIHSALKELLRLRGIDCGSVRAPLEEVSDSQRPALQAIHGMIMENIQEYALQ